MDKPVDDLQLVRLVDYKPPDFFVDTVSLTFELDPDCTRVTAETRLRRNLDSNALEAPLILDGENLKLEQICINGKELEPNEFEESRSSLIIANIPDTFTLSITTALSPSKNKSLEGLYVSGGRFCTQCEAEGFRKITFFPDRPDVLSRYRVEIRAPKSDYPILLSNGNRVSCGEYEDGRHFVIWEDPFPKPCYLFALVAGDLAQLSRTYRTASGRNVSLSLFVEHGKESRGTFALDSLERAMEWDERTYGLEYDLDEYNIVAVSDFNMGAMENKSLNIFNDKYVLADPQTATDDDYEWIEAIVAHEYFHNWTGNRVTCRDWFQLSLKEGLTVFREQQFSESMRSAAIKRIKDVDRLRSTQFPEDAGPLAHPVRPPSYAEISNFYTHTVYEKGAELVRMIHTLIGEESFKAGMQLYFNRHDGQAVTCEDFVKAMSDASGISLAQFFKWYEQAGTPILNISGEYDTKTKIYRVEISQSVEHSSDKKKSTPLTIPFRIGFAESKFGSIETCATEKPEILAASHLLVMQKEQENYSFSGFPDRSIEPVVTLNHGFTAPVIIKTKQSLNDLKTTCIQTIDPFVRWNSLQEIMMLAVLQATRGDKQDDTLDALRDCVNFALSNADNDPGETAQLLTLPSDALVEGRLEVIDPEAIFRARVWIQQWIASEFAEELDTKYKNAAEIAAYSPVGHQVSLRAVRSMALTYLTHVAGNSGKETARIHYLAADNLTDRWAALKALNVFSCPERNEIVRDFHNRYETDTLVFDKWFSLEAESPRSEAIQCIRELMTHKNFDETNPNRIRAILGTFATKNPIGFHKIDGSGYAFLATHIIKIDSYNPQVAARLAVSFQRWRKYDRSRQILMCEQLEKIKESDGISKDLREIVTKSLH